MLLAWGITQMYRWLFTRLLIASSLPQRYSTSGTRYTDRNVSHDGLLDLALIVSSAALSSDSGLLDTSFFKRNRAISRITFSLSVLAGIYHWINSYFQLIYPNDSHVVLIVSGGNNVQPRLRYEIGSRSIV